MSFSTVYPMLNVCWHFYFLRRLSEQLGHRLHHCAFRFDGVMWRRISLHLLFCLYYFSWNCFCSFWSASALIIVICTIKFRLSQMLLFQTFFQQLLHYLCSVPPFIWDIFRFTVTNVILYLFCKFSYSDDNNDFSLNVVKYSLWSVEWDSWYLNSGCWFSFFPSRVFTEVSHHWWGPWSDEICCSKAFLSFFWSPFLAFLAPKGVYIACFILVPFSLYLVCGECAQHWERRVQHWQRLNFGSLG